MTSIQIDRNDGLSSAVAVKGPCKAATSSNITLSGEQTIDGVACVTGDRVLVRAQTTASDNGIWKVDTGVWSRAKDFNNNRDVKTGTMVLVTGGTTSAALWQVTTANPIAIGSTSLTFGKALIQPTAAAVFDALSPTTTRGDLIFRNATTNTRLAASTAGYLLQTNGAGTDPTWAGFLQEGTGAAVRDWLGKGQDIVSVKDFGAKGDAIYNGGDGITTNGSTTVNSASGTFTAADVGKTIILSKGVSGGTPLVTTIATRVSATQITLATPATNAATQSYYYGTNDTTAIQNAANAAGALHRALYAPGGRYLHTATITLPQAANRILGDGPSSTVFIQGTPAINGFTFVATGSNERTDSFALIKSQQFANLSVMRAAGGNNGGIGIYCQWLPATNNQVYFTMDNVQVYTDGGTDSAWGIGVYLYNCNGSSIVNCVVKGNNADSNLTSANPYTMGQALFYDSDGTAGQINHYISHVTTGAASYGLFVNGWYEGFFIENCSFVQHWKGIYNSGSAHLNSVFNIVNCHMDVRTIALDFTSVFKLHVVNCDLFKNGGGGAPVGFAANLVNMVTCAHAQFIGNSLGTTDTTLPIGIVADGNCYRMIVEGNLFQSMTNGIVLNTTTNGAIVAGNIFYNCAVGVLLNTGTGGNIIGVNKYDGTYTNRISDISGTTTNQTVPFKYTAQKTAVFGSSLATQTVTFTIPAGVFVAAPPFATLATYFNSGLYPVFIYDSSSSTATSLVFLVREYQGATIAAGTYLFAMTAEALN
ncbi:hypothetical protein FJ434_16460 [Mesorhizobium sp. B2-5-13]|uniref:hypothetical protein n=1 Tax=unclassified Mesorhizobium TaxID=325217 RepID=UPI00112A009B|nr:MULTISPECIES: hypothetical protein [unclassified Mesorhizobium]TPJ85517.1 hypothetical protein FJ434_16460 [Mesorhizobium sp. B2-5-13]TPK39271.1 hypothetical protein FJ560_29400 [Mesorhizobium sp. B2-5-5]